MPEFRCRICRKTQPIVGGRCASCGTPVANATDHSKPRSNVPTCPRCGRTAAKEFEPGRFECRNCSAVYEADTESPTNDPGRNLLINMDQERRRRQGGRPGTGPRRRGA